MKAFLLLCLCFTSHLIFGQKEDAVLFTDLSIDSMGVIKWTSTYILDSDLLLLIVEKNTDGKWLEVGGFSSCGEITQAVKVTRNDSLKVKFHEGVNRYRIRFKKPFQATSKEIQLISRVSNDDGSLWIMGQHIMLDKLEYWEIMDDSGGVLKKGETTVVDISSLSKGNYWLYTKNSTRSFTKK